MSQIRQNFYNGQKVAPKNLNDLQSYVEERNAEMISGLMGYGIVEGFTVRKESEMIVSVTGGLAYTEQGVRLSSERGLNITIPSSELPNAGDRMVELALRFDWNKTGSATDSTGSAVTTDWISSVLLKLGSEIVDTDLKIAEIKLTPVGILEITENGQQFLNFEKLSDKVGSFSTETTHEAITANIDADIFNINNKSFEDTIRDIIYPIGAPYYQIVGQHLDPQVLYPNTVWEKLYDGDSVTVRTAGSLSNENRVNGIQYDAMQKMTGILRTSVFGVSILTDVQTSGILGVSEYINKYISPSVNTGSWGYPMSFNIDNSRQARTGTENRMRNVLWNMWIRRG